MPLQIALQNPEFPCPSSIVSMLRVMETLGTLPASVWRFTDLTCSELRSIFRAEKHHAAIRPRLDAGFNTTPSCCSSHRLRSSPPPYPVSDPLAPITR